jgi:HEPN domain-containing protein
MSDRDYARMLLRMVRKDLAALQGMADSSVFADEVFGFHAQQAVEKSIKAWLALLRVEFPKTHDLELLLTRLEEHAERIPEDFHDLVDLTDFAVQYRYEAFENLAEGLDRPGVTKKVELLVRHVEKRLSEAEKAGHS